MKLDLPPVKAQALAVRTIPEASDDIAAALGLPPGRRSLGLITATSDDALFASLDQGTKAARADVVYARSFYAGSGHASGPLSGECIGIYAADDPAEIDAALYACLAYLTEEAWFYAMTTAPVGAARAQPVLFFPHVIASTGRYLAPLAGTPVGGAMAYLIAPPLESIVGLDAACKAAPVKMTKWFGPPSETNFGGGYLMATSRPARPPRARSPPRWSTCARRPRRAARRAAAASGAAARPPPPPRPAPPPGRMRASGRWRPASASRPSRTT